MEKEWSNMDLIVLVQEYRKSEELWNRNHNLYRVKKYKNMAWKSLAGMFSCDVVVLRKKLNSILASYRRERAKVKEGEVSSWYLYSHMKFLQGYYKSPNGDYEKTPESYQVEALDDTLEIESNRTQASDVDEHEVSIVTKKELTVQPYEQTFVDVTPLIKKKQTRTINRKPKRQNMQNVQEMYSKVYVDSKIQELQNLIRQERKKKKDDCDTYGEYIASILRKHDNKTRCVIKQAINNIVYEQEMNKYENPLEVEMISESLMEHSDE